MLEQVSVASLDQDFKDELLHINRWFQCRSDAERTAALYTVVQNASQIQIRFLITVLQQLANQDSYSISSSAGQRNDLFRSRSVIEEESRKKQFYRQRNTYSTLSEPDKFISRPLGLSHPGPLYEKALAARAQLQAINLSSSSSVTNSTISSSSNSSLHSKSDLLFSRTSRLHSASSDLGSKSLLHSDLGSKPLLHPTPAELSSRSLFTNHDWPFPDKTLDEKQTSWAFGSLSKKTASIKKDTTWTIHEEEQHNPILSLDNALEQAHARLLKNDKPILSSPKCSSADNEDDNNSDTQQLTGLARRRKRSSQARALKDKIAAETVDFELMKDVQAWLRSLRLHKYGHAFIGLDWKQVVRMSDQDMIDAGVNTIGARRKLLKVFENVQRHCIENVTVFGCEMDCRRGVSQNFADYYTPVVQMSVDSLESQLTSSLQKVKIPTKITDQVPSTELTQDMQNAIHSSLQNFVKVATSKPRLAEGFYQVIFNEELPYKGDCNNPKRLTRKMPPPGESWTIEECEKMDYRCGNPPSICHFLDEVKQRCIGRMRKQLGEYASFDSGILVRSLVKDTRRSIYSTLANHGVGQLSEDKSVETFVARLVTTIVGALNKWVAVDVANLCETPGQEDACNKWDNEIKKEILKWP
ncbi:hypothetical protein G6F21_010767 [Rhizopus arrhizus]|nr:hypothetical protein G6F24_010986 [Rhizopus arrhizus]KAG0783038.1 hypothetical protein G6F21_010767 [Rhizopus arrhizus]